MRKLITVMLMIFFLSVLVGSQTVFGASQPAQATIAPSIFIQSPRDGEALQGIEIIEGKIRGSDFIRGKISFSYAGVENPTWFFIADIEPEENGGSQTSFRFEWDTSQITDGNYNLRVIAEYRNEAAIYELVSNLRIRNLSPIETSTPALVEEVSELGTPTITEDEVSEVFLTPTPLPLNPVVIKSENLSRTLLGSVVFVFVIFVVGGVYWFIRYRSK